MIFDVIPERFFGILASSNKRVYWECLEKMFGIMNNQLSFGVSREAVTDELVYYFDSNLSLEFEKEDSDDELTASDSREKANYMIRRLQECGWINIETNKSHEQIVNFYDYAVEVMKSLLSISKQEKVNIKDIFMSFII